MKCDCVMDTTQNFRHRTAGTVILFTSCHGVREAGLDVAMTAAAAGPIID